MKTRYWLNGVEINEPNNYEELSIDITYDKDGNTESLSINDWEFGVNDSTKSNDAVQIINKYIAAGLTGGPGVFEGIPFKITIDDERGTVYTLFDGYIDVSQAKTLDGERYSITAPAVETGKIDFVNDKADTFDYAFLDSISPLSSYYVPVPYCISKRDNGYEIIIAGVTIYVMIKSVKDSIKEIQKAAGSAGNPFETVGAVIAVTIEVSFAIGTLVAIAVLTIDLYNMLVQPVKYHNGMYVKDLLEIGLNHLGLKFSSGILQKPPFDKLLLLPKKYNIKESNTGVVEHVVGALKPNVNESEGYYKGTFGDLLRAMKQLFHAKIVIEGDTLFFEKHNYKITAPQYSIKQEDSTGFEFNHDDLVANRILTFTMDGNDRNTVQDYYGTSHQVIHSAITVNNKTMSTIKDFEELTIPFSRGIRKTELNGVEQTLVAFFKAIGPLVDGIISVINAVIKVVNKIIKLLNKVIKILKKIKINLGNGIPTIPTLTNPNIASLIEDRVDMMMMETDFIGIDKLILVNDNADKRNNKLLPDNETKINAEYIYDEYHYFDNFVTTKGWNNQMLRKQTGTIDFPFKDFEKVRLNSRALEGSKECILKTVKFKPKAQTATLAYNVLQEYTNNFKLTKKTPNE